METNSCEVTNLDCVWASSKSKPNANHYITVSCWVVTLLDFQCVSAKSSECKSFLKLSPDLRIG